MKLKKNEKNFAAMFIVYDWKWPHPWAGTETLYKLSIPEYTLYSPENGSIEERNTKIIKYTIIKSESKNNTWTNIGRFSTIWHWRRYFLFGFYYCYYYYYYCLLLYVVETVDKSVQPFVLHSAIVRQTDRGKDSQTHRRRNRQTELEQSLGR